MIPDSFTIASSGCGCGPVFMLIVIIIIVSSIISKGKKGGSGSTSGINFNSPGAPGAFKADLQGLKDVVSSFSSQAGLGTNQFGGAGGSLDGGFSAPVRRKKPPINWNVIKLNMTKEQIKECFDLPALNRGVKKENLPKYVNLSKLRNYFSEPQMRDMLDMDFFEKSAAAGATVAAAVARKKKKRFKDPYEKVAEIAAIEATMSERVAEVEMLEQFKEKTALEVSEEEKVMEDIQHYALYDNTFKGLVKKLAPDERKALALSFQNIANQTSKVSVKMDDVTQGIIWGEILKRRTSGTGRRGILPRR